MKKCPFCSEEIQDEAIKCRFCGSDLTGTISKKASINKKLGVFLFIVFWMAIILFILNDGINLDFLDNEKQLNNIQEKVATDFENQYQIAKNGGKLMDICVSAGLVKAGYLQANDSYNYNKWVDIEKEDCKKAGIEY